MNMLADTQGTTRLEALEKEIRSLEEFLREYYSQQSISALALTNDRELGSHDAAVFRQLEEGESNTVEHAWQIYSQAMRAAITGGANWPNLQLVAPATPEKILWDDPTFGPFYFHKVAADTMNAQGAIYSKTSNSFSERYGYFLKNIKLTPIDAEAEANAKVALSEFDQAGYDVGELYLSISLQWTSFDARQRTGLPPAQWITYERWAELTDRARVLTASKKLRDLKYDRYLYFMQLAYGGGEIVYRMLEKFDPKKLVEVTLPGLSPGQVNGKREVFPYLVSPSFPNWLQQVRQNSNPVSFTVRHDSGQYDYSRTSIAGGVGIGFGFFGILAAGGRTTVNIDTRESGFELSFKADIQPFDILPDSWYDSSAFSLYHDGPFVPGSPIEVKYIQGSLFGPNGFLNFRPARAIVAYKPEVKVKLRQTEYHYFKQVTQGAAGFFIGPFAVGAASYYDVQQSVRWDDNSGELTLFNAPDIPHLLAFDSEALG